MPPRTVEQYLAGVRDDGKRAALHKLRRTILAAAPRAEETISYGIPTVKVDGRPVVAYGAWANHLALYPMSYAVIRENADQLARFEVAKGTIRFQPDDPLPAALVRKIVKARLAQNKAKKRKR
jgi:uncharacterized protein YdhG (YjbR/CyaY superfamily)